MRPALILGWVFGAFDGLSVWFVTSGALSAWFTAAYVVGLVMCNLGFVGMIAGSGSAIDG